jgi:hypothetical protein
MAVKEGYVKPSFLNTIEEIDRFSQAIRHHLVMSIVGKKSEDFSISPKNLCNQFLDTL